MIISERIKRVFEHENWILGPEVAELEARVADYTGRKHAIACGSGADALCLALDAAGINEFSTVATTPFTFGATASAILRTGAKLIFVDIGDDLQIDARKVAALRTMRSVDAVVPVDLFGGMPNYQAITESGVMIIEDAAQAFGAEYEGRKAGAFGFAGCFSFHPSKPLGAIGDAGMVVTDDKYAERIMQRRRNHGQSAKYNYVEPGLNSRMDSIQAAAILDKLDNYDAELKRRRTLARLYRDNIEGVRHPIQAGGIRNPSFSIYPVLFDSSELRERAKVALSQAGLWGRVYYPRSLHLEPAFSFLGHKRGDFPRAERACETILALPMDEKASQVDQIELLFNVLEGVLKK